MLDSIGATIYFAIPTILGWFFHDAIDAILVSLTRFGQYGLILIGCVLAVYLCGRWIRRHAFIRQLRMDRIFVSELVDIIDGGQSPVIFDVRSIEARIRDGIIPGSLAAHPSEMTSKLENYPRDVEVVVYCSLPERSLGSHGRTAFETRRIQKNSSAARRHRSLEDAGRPIDVPR